MSPDLVQRIRRALSDARSSLQYVDNVAHRDPPLVGFGVRAQVAAECEALAEILRGDPAAMPEPDAGMRVTLASGRRAELVAAEPSKHESAAWVVWATGCPPCLWTPAHIREIRTPDGRVLWRAL